MKNSIVKFIRKILPQKIIAKLELGYRKTRLAFFNFIYRNPSRNLKILAITGTNGKTTSMSILNEILKAGGKTTLLSTTAGREVAGEYIEGDGCQTVPSTKELQRLFALAQTKKIDYFLLEVTSHALTQYKIPSIKIEAAGITNLTQEHLDYHKTMESYADAKLRLFTDFEVKHKVLNADDEWYDYFVKRIDGEVISYGATNKPDFQIKKVTLYKKGSEITFSHKGQEFMVTTPLAGKFNAYNVSLAVAMAFSIGIDVESIIEGVANLKAVKGRLEWLPNQLGIDVLVDYAHTPDGVEKLLELAKEVTRGRVILVFGSAGERDLNKLPAMGRAAARYADEIYVTDEENRSEPAENIRNGILKGIKESNTKANAHDVADRGKAIRLAIASAQPKDLVIVAGLGHQNYRNMNGVEFEWNDIVETQKILDELTK